MAIIEVNNVSKLFPARRGVRHMLGRGGLQSVLMGDKSDTFAALEDISFNVNPGESLGIIGSNGSGKSTLLKILAGVTLPTTGDVVVRGRVASLLELGAGFHSMLTGRENIFLNAGLMGMRHAQVAAVAEEIIDFSGIRDFIDQPVDTYSSGMYVRIAFAVAVHVNPDIFLVDEVLAVGDEEFQRKCRLKIGEFIEQGKTIVFVSHDLGIVNTLCDRLILLNKGQMIQRETPQKTMDYYLRLVGGQRGIHTFSAGDTEVINSNGRISIFHNREEVTAPSGFCMHIESMGQQHEGTQASWEVTQQDGAGCVTEGRMARLPIRLIWRLTLAEGILNWDIAFECEREISITQIEANLFLPTIFGKWIYGDMSGDFPDIEPGDIVWTSLVAQELSATEAAALPVPEGGSMPPALFRLEESHPNVRLVWANSDYVQGSRVLQVVARFPVKKDIFEAGRHTFARIQVDLSRSVEDARRMVREERSLQAGKLGARFEQGKVILTYGDVEISHALHLYTSLLMGHLWNDSQGLQWGRPVMTGNRLEISGESRRFPFVEHWEMELTEGVLALRIWLEAKKPLKVEEYHTSIALTTAYTAWSTMQESGEFPTIEANSHTWQHQNENYATGNSLRALSSELPSVTIENISEEVLVRMTPVNTGFEQNARVLQALRTPQSGLLLFEPGRHLYFDGLIRIDDSPAPA
jgi:ABC-type polysaccharide/polyol phosphate transport system ATPase subunit